MEKCNLISFFRMNYYGMVWYCVVWYGMVIFLSPSSFFIPRFCFSVFFVMCLAFYHWLCIIAPSATDQTKSDLITIARESRQMVPLL